MHSLLFQKAYVTVPGLLINGMVLRAYEMFLWIIILKFGSSKNFHFCLRLTFLIDYFSSQTMHKQSMFRKK